MTVRKSAPFRMMGLAPSGAAQVLNLVDSTIDAPNAIYSNPRLLTGWKNGSAGDWIDATGAQQGGTAFASANLTSFTPALIAWNIPASLIAKLLIDGNTGLFLRRMAGVGATSFFSSRENIEGLPIPTLSVPTTNGAVQCPLLADCDITGTPSNAIEWRTPGILKFDLSGITGTVTGGATLTCWYRRGFAGQTFPQTIGVFYADLPRIFYDPATQIGAVQQGLANTVARDSGLAALVGPAAGVFFYAEFQSLAQTITQWQGLGTIGVTGDLLTDPSTVPATFTQWPEYGMKVARVGVGPPNVRASAFHAFVPPANAAYWWKANWGASPHQDLYFRHMLMIDADVSIGMTELGVKLPGANGTYGFTLQDQPDVSDDDNWSGRMEHGRYSPANDCYRYFWYWYGADNSILEGFGSGRFDDGVIHQICLKPARKYCFEQRVKLNTFAAGVAQTDGILESWVDGVKWYSKSDVLIRQDDDRIQFECVPFFNIYHGGNTPPSAPIHYEISGVCVATQYIGPPKKIGT